MDANSSTMKRNYDNLPQEMKDLPQWVAVSNRSKIPLDAYYDQPASVTDPSTWRTFETACVSVEKGLTDGIGFVFHNNGIVGIDIDCGFEKGLMTRTAADILLTVGSYAEKSRSGRGMHILVKGSIPFKGKNNGEGIEIYQDGRYFICTGDTIIYKKMIENQKAIDYILNTYFKDAEKVEKAVSNGRIYSPVYESPDGRKIVLKRKYPAILQGSRHISLVSLAGQLHNYGYGKAEIYDELLRCNEEACNPPLREIEVQQIVNSVSKYKR